MNQRADGVTVSIVMVSYNAADELRRTLTAITGPAAPHVPYEILVTDNGSTDTAADVAEALLGPGAVVRLGHNTGFGFAVNRTVERAVGDYLLLLNPDACPKPGAIDSLLNHLLAHPTDGIVGGRSLNPAGQLDPRSCFGRITPWSLTSWAAGLAGFDETYRIYGEDQDLCLRAAAAGFRPSITPDAVVVHAVGASSDNRAN